MQNDREFEIHKTIEELEEEQYQCDKLRRQIDQMEDDFLCHNRTSKELNDEVFDSYQHDNKLREVLLNREELLQQKHAIYKNMFQEFRDRISEARKQATDKLDNCREELNTLSVDNAPDGGQVENNNYTYEA